GETMFPLTGGAIEQVKKQLTLRPCVDCAAGSPHDASSEHVVCQMPPPPPDGGDGGVDGDAGDAGDAGDGSTACPGSNVPALASVDAGVVPSACETYCVAAVSHCPDLFPRLPSPTPNTGDPEPIDIC